MNDLREKVSAAFADREKLKQPGFAEAVRETIALLDQGKLRVAEKGAQGWSVNAWAKEAIFPEDRFPGAADRAPEMRSTGEVMAGGATAVEAYQRALRAAGRSKAYGRGEVGPSLQELVDA